MSRGRRTARPQTGMNLFPFLAVLICTMGSLIVLLVVMVQQARARAHTGTELEPAVVELQDAADDSSAPGDSAEDRRRLAREKQEQVEHFQWQASLLRQAYARAVEQLAERRKVLSHLESHARQLSQTATQMQAKADAIARAAETQKVDQQEVRDAFDQLQDNIAAAKLELAETRQKLAEQPPRRTYALIPYEGPSGTHRRPIYVECLSDRVVLQPEGVTLWGEDFREPLGIANPLAAALRAKREFLLEHGLINEDDEPYPLLVVRPRAAASYAACRAAMTAWDAEFGYELIEENLELDYRAPNPKLADVLEEVVAEARDRRRRARIVRLRERQRPPKGLLRASPSGGFEPVNGGTSGLLGAEGRGGRAGGVTADPDHGLTVDGQGVPFGSESKPFGSGSAGSPSDGDAGGSAELLGPASGGRWDAGHENTLAANDGQGFDRQGFDRLTSDAAGPGGAVADDRARSAEELAGGDEAGPAGMGSRDKRQGGASPSGNGPSRARGSGSAAAPTTAQASPASTPFQDMQPLADTRGSGWALPDAAADAVGIRRPIPVLCDADRLVLLPERDTSGQVQVFKHHGNVEAVIDPFLNSVRQRLRGWGIAGRGIYWKPILQVEVPEGAGGNFAQLVRMLEDSGIQVSRQP